MNAGDVAVAITLALCAAEVVAILLGVVHVI